MKYSFLLLTTLNLFFIISCKKTTDNTYHPTGNHKYKYYPTANQTDTLFYDGQTRTFILHVPSSYTDGINAPLIVALHGYSSNANNFEDESLLSQKSDSEGFIVVYPNGLQYPWTSNNPRAWNAGGSYEEWTGGTADVGFIDQMIVLISSYYSVDSSRIYVTGHSNGAMMTYRIGFELSGKIAAIAPHSGQMIYTPAGPMDYPVPVLHLHALNDNAVLYYGNPLSDGSGYESVDAVLGRWATKSSCDTTPDTIFTNSEYMIKEWKCSENSSDILLYLSNMGGHTWFTMANSGISANDVIWEFFKSHPKN